MPRPTWYTAVADHGSGLFDTEQSRNPGMSIRDVPLRFLRSSSIQASLPAQVMGGNSLPHSAAPVIEATAVRRLPIR